MRVIFVLDRALLNFYLYYGDSFKMEYPAGLRPHDEPLEVAKMSTAQPHLPSR